MFLYYAGYYVLAPILNLVQKFLPIHFVEGYLVSGAKGGGPSWWIRAYDLSYTISNHCISFCITC